MTQPHAAKFSHGPRDVNASLLLSSRRDHTDWRYGEAAIGPIPAFADDRLSSFGYERAKVPATKQDRFRQCGLKRYGAHFFAPFHSRYDFHSVWPGIRI
jgi:hypothetical protein